MIMVTLALRLILNRRRSLSRCPMMSTILTLSTSLK
jgi:hypothetical protein